MKISQEFFENLVNFAGGGIVITDLKGKIIYVNPAIGEMLGYSQKELIGGSVKDITDPEDLISTRNAIKEASINPGYQVQLEKIYLKKNGSRFYGLTTVKSFVAEGETLLSAFINDFSDQYIARHRIEKQYRDIVELADDIIFSVDPSGNFLYGNTKSQEVTGLSEEELLKANYLSLVSPSYKKEVEEFFYQHFLSKNDKMQYTFPIVDSAGELCWLDQKLNTIWDVDRIKIVGYTAVARKITNERETRQKLFESENHYQALFHQSPIPKSLEDFSLVKKYIDKLKGSGVKGFDIYFTDHPEEIKKCASLVKVIEKNKQVLNLHGAANEKELNENISQVFTAQTHQTFKQELIGIAAGRSLFETQTVVKTLKGEERHVELKWMVMPGYESTLEKVMITTADVTESIASEKALKESKLHYETLFQNISVPIIISDPVNANIVEVNQVAVATLGYSERELLGMNIADLDDDHDLSYVVSALQRCYDEGLVEGETKWRNKAGQVRHISVKNSLIKIAGKDRILSACTDITKLKQLNSENERFRTVMNDAPFAIYITDLDGNLIDANRTATKHLKFTKRELLTLSMEDIEVHFDENKNTLRNIEFKETIKNRDGSAFSTYYKRKDTSLFPANVTITGGKIGNEEYIVASVFDDTKSKENITKIKEQNQVLKIIQTLQSEFISGANLHEQFTGFLDSLLLYTKSAFGFIGEILTEDGVPYLKTHAITDISWDGETKLLYDEMNKKEFEFRGLKTLFGFTILTGEMCISNDPQNDPGGVGIPHGHPLLESYIGIPIKVGEELIGMVGLANKKKGYDESIVDDLKYFISTYSIMIQAMRTKQDKHKTEVQLKELNKALKKEVDFRKSIQKYSIDVEEKERKRVARDLHDGLGQRLTAAKLSLGAIKNSKNLKGHVSEILDESITLIESSMSEVRTISQDILPVVLSDFGLSEALEKVCNQVNESTGIVFNFSTAGVIPPIEDFVKTSLYRIGQECINNATKYSKSTSIEVKVEYSEKENALSLLVKDFGVGFDQKKVKGGMGLNNIRERAAMIKAKVKIQSKLNKGTGIQVKYLF